MLLHKQYLFVLILFPVPRNGFSNDVTLGLNVSEYSSVFQISVIKISKYANPGNRMVVPITHSIESLLIT